MLRKLARIFLAAALLFAAQGALEHPLVHLDELVDAAQCAHDHPHGPDRSDAAGHACDMCVAFAAVGIAADHAAPVLRPDAPAAPLRSDALLGRFLPRAPPAFQSQAPPLFS